MPVVTFGGTSAGTVACLRAVPGRRRRVHVAIAGATGIVGKALLRLIGEQESWLRRERDLELSVVNVSPVGM